RRLPPGARALPLRRRARRDPRDRPRADREPARAGGAVRLGRPVPAPPLAAAGLGLGLALAAGAAACASPAVRLVLAAAGLAAVGWWWGSARLDTLDR